MNLENRKAGELEYRPTPETLELRSHLEEQIGIGSYGWAVAFESMAEKCCDLERQRDLLLEALLGVLEDWEGGYRPEDCGTTMAIAREAIAEVEGSR